MKQWIFAGVMLWGMLCCAAAPKIVYRNALEAPFELAGMNYRGANGELRRLPAEMDGKLQSKEVEKNLVFHTSGAVIRFRTNSNVIMIRGELVHADLMTHMTIHGACGMQLASETGDKHKLFRCCCASPANLLKGKNGAAVPIGGKYTLNNGGKLRNFTLYLPLYSGVKKLEIGLEEGSKLEKPPAQKFTKPVVFYGSSITQGCSAATPGRTYAAMLCAKIEAPLMSLGFSNSAHGEPAMAEFIATLPMSAFVMDYDYNASNLKELEERHEAFYKTIRAKQPSLPILILSGPRDPSDKKAQSYRAVIRRTFDNAVAAGDKHVYFVDGFSYYRQVPWKFTTVDLTHPTDLGFQLMYQTVLPVLKQALKVQ